jgi:hypothetical protein
MRKRYYNGRLKYKPSIRKKLRDNEFMSRRKALRYAKEIGGTVRLEEELATDKKDRIFKVHIFRVYTKDSS